MEPGGTKFWLAVGAASATHVNSLIPLTADEAVDPRLDPNMFNLRGTGWYVDTGISVSRATNSRGCTFRKQSDHSELNIPNAGEFCTLIRIQDYHDQHGGPEPWYEAISGGDLHLTTFVAARIEPASACKSLSCPLAAAVQGHKWSLVREFVERRADPNICVYIGPTPTFCISLLEAAAETGDVSLVKFLLDKGATFGRDAAIADAKRRQDRRMLDLLSNAP